MPFDGSGNFSRLYSWAADRDAGIRILASRMDGEFDNFAGGMNLMFFRNGLVPMSGNLNMGQNSITGLAAGTPSALSFKWSDDPNSGLFLNGYNRPTLVAAGAARLEANSAGVIVTGTLNSTGALTENASRVWTAATLDPTLYAPKASPVFTGVATSARYDGTGIYDGSFLYEAFRAKGVSGALAFYDNSNTRTAYVGMVNNGDNRLFVTNLATSGSQGSPQVVINIPNYAGSPSLTLGSQLSSTVPINVNGAQVWTSATLNPASYAQLGSSVNFTSVINGTNSDNVTLAYGKGTTGYINFNVGGSRRAYIGGGGTADPVPFSSTTGWTFDTPVTRTDAGQFLYQTAIGLTGAVSRGTAAPTGGADGDIYLQYT